MNAFLLIHQIRIILKKESILCVRTWNERPCLGTGSLSALWEFIFQLPTVHVGRGKQWLSSVNVCSYSTIHFVHLFLSLSIQDGITHTTGDKDSLQEPPPTTEVCWKASGCPWHRNPCGTGRTPKIGSFPLRGNGRFHSQRWVATQTLGYTDQRHLKVSYISVEQTAQSYLAQCRW